MKNYLSKSLNGKKGIQEVEESRKSWLCIEIKDSNRLRGNIEGDNSFQSGRLKVNCQKSTEEPFNIGMKGYPL